MRLSQQALRGTALTALVALLLLLLPAPPAVAAYEWFDDDIVNARTDTARFSGDWKMGAANKATKSSRYSGGLVRWSVADGGVKRGEFKAPTYARAVAGKNPRCIAARVRWQTLRANPSFSLPASASLEVGIDTTTNGYKVSCRGANSDTPPRRIYLDGVNHSSRLMLRVHADICELKTRDHMWACATDSNAYGDNTGIREAPDTTAPAIDEARVTLQGPSSRYVDYQLLASDDRGVASRRVAVNGVWRDWTAYRDAGTLLLPDSYGNFGIKFQVKDGAGNVSDPKFAGTVTRTAAVRVELWQIDNGGNARVCGDSEASACSDVVTKFRTTVSSAVMPSTDLLFKAWRKVNGSWVETATSPFKRVALTSRTIDVAVTENLLDGLWRFQSQVPRDSTRFTEFGASNYQYLLIDSPDTAPPTITGAGLSHGDEASQYVGYSLSATDNASGVTQMRVFVNGAARSWVAYSPSGHVVLPDGYGNFGIGFQVMDGAGNASPVHFAGSVTRKAAVGLALNQIDNYGNDRSCGDSYETACSAVVRKFRTSISSPISPDANLLLKAWRYYNGAWHETSTSPFMYEAINGRSTIDMTVTANLLAGVWRFQAQVPVTGTTQFAASNYQYLRI